jgi:4-hydroxy-tetrahydrodipicolinate synthase
MHAMCVAALARDRETAASLDADLAGLHDKLFLESNPIPVKWALAEMGMIEPGIRLPLTWFSDSMHDALRSAMRRAGIL